MSRPGAVARRVGRAAHVVALVIAVQLAAAPVTDRDLAATPAAVPAAADEVRGQWSWPIDPPWLVLREFQGPPTVYAAGHRGIDLASSWGAPVYSPADGTVFFSGWVVDRPVLSIAHEGGLVSSFEPVDATVVAGQQVLEGQQVGDVAAGAHCTADCIHVGLRLHGDYISLMLMLRGVPRAVLYPVE